jgi:hypothetical protein
MLEQYRVQSFVLLLTAIMEMGNYFFSAHTVSVSEVVQLTHEHKVYVCVQLFLASCILMPVPQSVLLDVPLLFISQVYSFVLATCHVILLICVIYPSTSI